MSCTIDDEGLKCTFPESYETVSIFSHPVDAEQRSVGTCVRLTEKYTCSVDKGFGAVLKNVSQLLFTLSDTVKENEKFFCQAGYDPKVACQWNRKGAGNQTPPTAEGEKKQNDLTVPLIVAAIIAGIAIFILGFIISWIFYRRKNSKTRCCKFFIWNTRPGDVYVPLKTANHTCFCPTEAEGVNDAEDNSALRTPLKTSPPPETTIQQPPETTIQQPPPETKTQTPPEITSQTPPPRKTKTQPTPTTPPPLPPPPLLPPSPRPPSHTLRLKELRKMMARPELLTEEHIKHAKRMVFLKQAAVLKQSTSKLFLTGPPCTGKTMVLFLKGVEWLQKGEDVYIMTTWRASRAVTFLLYSLMLRSINLQKREQKSSVRLHLLLCDLAKKEEVDKTVGFLSKEAKGKKLHIIADEVGPPFASYLHDFCDELLAKVPDLHFWAASCFTSIGPSSFEVERLTRPIRYPLEIVKEEQKQEGMSEKRTIDEHSRLIKPDSGNNSPVKHLYHRGKGHSEKYLTNCSTCGQELAKILHSFRSGVLGNVANSTSVPSSGGRASPLEWRDMLVLHSGRIKGGSGILVGLKDRDIPVRVMENHKDVDDVATANSDVVWVADEYSVLGLERAVVVCLGDVDRLHILSERCSHLVVVSDHY